MPQAPTLTSWKKHDSTGKMAFYKGYIEYSKGGHHGHIGIIHAFRNASQKFGANIIPTTVGLGGPRPNGVKDDAIGFEFAVSSDVSGAQGRKILADVKKTTGARITVR